MEESFFARAGIPHGAAATRPAAAPRAPWLSFMATPAVPLEVGRAVRSTAVDDGADDGDADEVTPVRSARLAEPPAAGASPSRDSEPLSAAGHGDVAEHPPRVAAARVDAASTSSATAGVEAHLESSRAVSRQAATTPAPAAAPAEAPAPAAPLAQPPTPMASPLAASEARERGFVSGGIVPASGTTSASRTTRPEPEPPVRVEAASAPFEVRPPVADVRGGTPIPSPAEPLGPAAAPAPAVVRERDGAPRIVQVSAMGGAAPSPSTHRTEAAAIAPEVRPSPSLEAMGGPPSRRAVEPQPPLPSDVAPAPGRERRPTKQVHIGTLHVTVKAAPSPAPPTAPVASPPAAAIPQREPHRDPWDGYAVSFH